MSRRKTFFCFLFSLLLACSLGANAWAQGSELGSVEGTVTDKSGAVVPGVSVTVKNKATGFERVVVSEDNGYFRVPSLQPGKYSLTAELSGFSKFVVDEAIVNAGTSTNVKVTLEPAGTQEVVTVSGAAPLVDVSKTDVGGVVDNRAVENQPLNGRNFSSLALMIPGVRPVGAWDPTKTRIGAISIAGAGGRNINTTVDGIDNKDNTVGGYVQNVSIEAIQEFALKTQRFSAADGRSQGGLLSIVTKSGSNSLHGSFFSFFRNDTLNANDYFSKKQNVAKPEFSRKQFGGSIGGPIAKDRAFFFFAIERLNEDQSLIVPPDSFKELSALKASGVSIYGATPQPAQQIPTPFRNTLTTARVDFSFTEKNNAYLSWSENRDNTLNDQGVQDLTTTNFNKNKNELFSFVLKSILSPTKLNQFTAGYSYWNNLIDTDHPSPVTVNFASVTFGTNGNVPQQSYQVKWQLKDAFNWTAGNHGWQFGTDYVFEPKLGGFFEFVPVPEVDFFDNPTTILNDKKKYPQGFATPGIVQGIFATNGDPRFDVDKNIHMLGWYVQDDWKFSRKLTLNLGLRYDVDINLLGASAQTRSRTYLALKKINSPISNGWVSRLPGNDTNNFAPRIGFAYDPVGDGKTVIRGGYGVYYDQVFLNIPLFMIQQANRTVFDVVLQKQNDDIGVGELSGFVLNKDPLPPIPAALTDLPIGARGRIVNPDYVNPVSQQFNIGFSHQFARDLVISADYTHVLNLHESRRFQLNPRRGDAPTGQLPRVLEPAFVAAGLPKNRIGEIRAETSWNRSRYDGVNVQIRKRLSHGLSFQVSHTISRALGYAGSSGEFGATARFDQFNIFDPRELAPTTRDERHRFTASAIWDLPWGFQISPVLQAATARPYSLAAGRDVNRDGVANDLCVPGTAAPNGRVCPFGGGINSQRGGFDLDGNPVSAAFFLMDLRVSKYVNLSRVREDMKVGLFFEAFNLTNRINFGNAFTGNVRSSNFMTAVGLPTGTYGPVAAAPFQAQLGFRFSF